LAAAGDPDRLSQALEQALERTAHTPEWSSDGNRIAFVRSGIIATQWLIRPISSIYTIPAGGGPSTLVVSGTTSRNENPRWRPQ
jgi:Tol biopolymer transport system component